MANLKSRIEKLEKLLTLKSRKVPIELIIKDRVELIFNRTLNGRKVRLGFEEWTEKESVEYIKSGEMPIGKPPLGWPEWAE